MSLQSELDTFKTGWLERVGPETARLVASDIDALKSLAAQARKAGDSFPALSLARGDDQMVDLGEIMSRGPAIVTFYRGGWCPYCNLELRAFQNLLPGIQSLGATLVAVSPETPDHTIATAEKNGVAFTVLSDARVRSPRLSASSSNWHRRSRRSTRSSATISPRATTIRVGPCRCRPPMSSRRVGSSPPPSSIPITAAAWNRRLLWPPCAPSPASRRPERPCDP